MKVERVHRAQHGYSRIGLALNILDGHVTAAEIAQALK